MKARLQRLIVWCAMALVYGCTAALPRRLRGRRNRQPPTGRVLVTGTFYNEGWYLSHLRPLAQSGARDVIVVTDVPQPPVKGVTVLCPTPMDVRLLGRAGAKLHLMLQAGRKYQPDLYMGYHLFPGALCALIVARLMGRPVAYQMTGGPVEIIGGGHGTENVLMSKLGKPSAVLERWAVACVQQFDLVVVRGQQARRFLAERGVQNIAIITGSVQSTNGMSYRRTIDLIFVGRLTEVKRPDRFVQVVAQVAKSHPGVRAVMIGGGPDRENLERQAEEAGVRRNIEFLGQRSDVTEYLRQSKVFVLTSRSEGMAIALIEAMACGVPAVAADVGELSDVVRNGVNGWLVQGDRISSYARHGIELLDDPQRWQAFSQAAHESAIQLSGEQNVAQRWHACLEPFQCVLPDECSESTCRVV